MPVTQTAIPSARTPPRRWHEVTDDAGQPRPVFTKLLRDFADLTQSDLRTLDDRMEATLREMGVTFDLTRSDPWGRQPWTCDLLPHIFSSSDWQLIVRGFRQRLRAFEMFLADVYGKKEILRAGVLPIQVVLGSPHYQLAAVGVPRPRDAFLHLSGMCICRAASGAWEVKHHHFSHATGISYMMQNRRALARVIPEIFQDTAVHSLAEMPLVVLERLRETAQSFGGEPTVVLLTPGATSAVSSEQSFLARRMGIPMVAGGDLLVLDDCVYLKTVRGLERVEVIFNRVADAWLDPLVFRADSLLGVPGLVHCLRRGTVALVNAVGSQLADDRSLLVFAPKIIRYYLNEPAILPTVQTLWLGDIDQRELVLDNLSAYRIRPIFRENTSGSWDRALPGDEASLRAEIKKQAGHFVAQPAHEGALTRCFESGRAVEHSQDHIVFAARTGDDFNVFPGALTRVFSRTDSTGDFGFGWTSKDSWVLADSDTTPLLPQLARRTPDTALPPRQVTSRVAEAFYWIGRYLERAHHQAYLISVVAIGKSFKPADDSAGNAVQAIEIELSAFLRLLGSRDAYRRIFQMRAEPAAVLELLWQHAEVPRSVHHCLRKCGTLLRESIDPEMPASASAAIDEMIRDLQRIDWAAFVRPPQDEDRVTATHPAAPPTADLTPLLARLLAQTLEIHTHISDSFLNHQAHIARVTQAPLVGL